MTVSAGVIGSSCAVDPVGIVLCGGASVRMGRDKASMGDPPWAHRVAAALTAAGCTTVELQGGAAGLGTASWSQIQDLAPGGGPVPAIAQAAARHSARPVVVAACDLPNLGPAAVKRLLDAVVGGERSAAAYRVAGRANWSLVVLDADLVERFAAMAPAELVGRSLRSLLPRGTILLDPADAAAVTDIDELPTSS